MDQIELQRERRRQLALERLGSNTPICVRCGEADWRCLEHDRKDEHGTEPPRIVCRKCKAKQAPRTAQQRSAKLQCVICGDADPRCYEAHHIAGRKYDCMTVPTCLNCHRKLTDMQKDHPQ